MSRKRAIRDSLSLIEREGFAVLRVVQNGHVKVAALAPGGRATTLVVSVSPSDWRQQRNLRAQLRRLTRGEGNPADDGGPPR